MTTFTKLTVFCVTSSILLGLYVLPHVGVADWSNYDSELGWVFNPFNLAALLGFYAVSFVSGILVVALTFITLKQAILKRRL